MVQSFPRERRIRRRPEFQRVYEAGSKSHGRFMTLFVLATDFGVSRLGVSASRKIGGAVVRNRAKRLVREVFRTTAELPPMDVVVVPRQNLIEAGWDELVREFLGLLDRSRRKSGGRRGA